MLQKSLANIMLWLLFQMFVEINCQMTPFKPAQRIVHTATFIDNKLYILGGAYTSNGNASNNEFFS